MAASGDPNKGPMSVPLSWPQYSNATDTNIQVRAWSTVNAFRLSVWAALNGAVGYFSASTLLQFALPFSTTVHLNQARCDMWDSVLDQLMAHGGVN